MRLYSTSSDQAQPTTRPTEPNPFDSNLSYPHSPQDEEEDEEDEEEMIEKQEEKPPSVMEFSRTLNTATRSAQNITQDIDMLQANIESLANDLGIDPSRFDEETDQHLQNGYNPMFTTEDTKLLTADLSTGSSEFYEPYKRKESNVVPYPFDMQSRSYPPMQDATIPLQTRPYLQTPAQLMNVPPTMQRPSAPQRVQPPQRMYTMPCLTEEKPLQPESTENGSYRQFLNSMNYSDAYYSINQESDFQQQRNNFDHSTSHLNRRHPPRMNTFYGSTSDEDMVMSNQEGFHPTLVNPYSNSMRPRYFNNMTTNENEDNFHDNT
ncbi:hypothetical protein A0J61_11949 [Choanephora cucurbitarum]|uniref:Uncharacterized protein n=1 Tax=Choanephora cucurbitarum TaxID=101091 RepID=A0A1C7LJN3_9FUNG|nr:hypothetical protein A0J61_11949 [Choanephora cucurbitarum]